MGNPSARSRVAKVFVSVYASTETNTTAAHFGTNGKGSNLFFLSNGTLLRGRTLRCHNKLYTNCSLAVMVAGAMFEILIDSEL